MAQTHDFQRICFVHYHELGLKGKNRSTFERQLMRNIEGLITDNFVEHVGRISGRIVVYLQPDATYQQAEDLLTQLSMIPGTARVSAGFQVGRNINSMIEAAKIALHEVDDFYTWKVQARRAHTDFEINSMDMNAIIGEALVNEFPDKKVKMKNPDVEVRVEVVQAHAYIFARSIQGIGGLPVGTAGKVVCLLSSGIDSPVAMWRMARRGATCIGVHFSGRPMTQATSEYLVDDIGHVLEKFGAVARIYIVPIGEYQREIAACVPQGLRVVMYRRLMMRVAEKIAHMEGAKALVTGESLGQVASQTLDNLAATHEAVDMQILRPLIGNDKLEIIAEAQRIGTFDISNNPAPDCCTLFMPRNPETHAKMPEVLEAEKLYDWKSWIDEIASEVT